MSEIGQKIADIQAKRAGKKATKKVRRAMTRAERRASERHHVAQVQRGNRVHSRKVTRSQQDEFIAEMQIKVLTDEIPGTERIRDNIVHALPAEQRAELDAIVSGRS